MSSHARKKRERIGRRFRWIFFRLIFSTVLFLGLAEGALQAGHRVIERAAGRAGGGGEGLVILCAGDSHTYGYMLAEMESYPAKLQQMLAEEGIEAVVINAGVPGENTSQLRRRLPELLRRYHPGVVLIQSSSNNDWNKRDTLWSDLRDGVLPPGLWTSCRRAVSEVSSRLRTVTLVSFFWHRWLRPLHPKEMERDREGRIYFHSVREKKKGWESVAVVSDRTRRDLRAIVREVRQAGAEPVLLNYVGQPVGTMELANRLIAEMVALEGVSLVDNDAFIRPRFWRPDGTIDWAERDRVSLPDHNETHLSGEGNALVAENVFTVLKREGLLERK